MSSTIFNDLAIAAGSQFIEMASEPSPNTNLYLTIGKINAWANDLSPDTATTSLAAKVDLWKNMIGGKRVSSNDMSQAIIRHNWAANTIYIAYDNRNSEMGANDVFYVMTSDYNVYKCLANNNGGQSTVKPTYTLTNTTQQTADGYIWKYMYTVTDANRMKFLTPSYIPVKTLSIDNGSVQWQVQEDAVAGAIHNILLTNAGSGYTNASNLVVTISGDGSDCAATANINVSSNTVETITITNPGDSYSFANVTISGGGGTGATARAIISPFGGHGSDPLYELNGRDIIIYSKISFDESGKLPTTNEFRQVGLIQNPYIRGTSNAITNTAFTQLYQITTVGADDYEQDEYVYQGPNFASATFTGMVAKWDSANGIVYTVNNVGIPTSDALIGSETSTSRTISNVNLNEVEKFTGQVLYINNITPVERADDQQEVFQIVMRF